MSAMPTLPARSPALIVGDGSCHFVPQAALAEREAELVAAMQAAAALEDTQARVSAHYRRPVPFLHRAHWMLQQMYVAELRG